MLKPPTEKITAETREKLLALAEFIENDRTYEFDMDWYFRPWEAPAGDVAPCGTACCIAGHAILLHGDKISRGNNPVSGYIAAQLLGIPVERGTHLFNPWLYENIHDADISRAKAVRVLRNFAYTGDVDWSV